MIQDHPCRARITRLNRDETTGTRLGWMLQDSKLSAEKAGKSCEALNPTAHLGHKIRESEPIRKTLSDLRKRKHKHGFCSFRQTCPFTKSWEKLGKAGKR
jgi:hypothetical protein